MDDFCLVVVAKSSISNSSISLLSRTGVGVVVVLGLSVVRSSPVLSRQHSMLWNKVNHFNLLDNDGQLEDIINNDSSCSSFSDPYYVLLIWFLINLFYLFQKLVWISIQ